MNPEQNNEVAAAAAPTPETITETAADLNAKPPVIEGVTEEPARELTPQEQAEAAQRAQQEAEERLKVRREASLLKDSMEFLTRTKVTSLGNGFYRCGSRILASDSSVPFQSSFIQKVAIMHIGGQKALQYLTSKTIFKLEEFQSVFNGVPIEPEERQVLVMDVVTAAIQAAYDSVSGYIGSVFPIVGAALGANLEQLRIPAEKDGGKFLSVEALYVTMGARFRLDYLIGVIIKYEGEDNYYAVAFTDFSADPQSDEALDVRVFTDEVLGMRNRYIDQYIVGTLPDLLATIVAKAGGHILPPPQIDLSQPSANDGDTTDSTEQPA